MQFHLENIIYRDFRISEHNIRPILHSSALSHPLLYLRYRYIYVCTPFEIGDRTKTWVYIFIIPYIFILSSTADQTVSIIAYTTWLTFVLCSLKMRPSRFHMGIFDRPPDSSNIGPTLLHSSHIAKMRKILDRKANHHLHPVQHRPHLIHQLLDHCKTSTQLMITQLQDCNFSPFSQHWSLVTSDEIRSRYSSSGSS